MKHIHFIGICGVGMSALAILWKKKGWKVTGSDSGFYPPISTHLEQNNIDFYPGWHPEKMGVPDLAVVGNVAGSENPEWRAVQEKHIPHVSYPELIANELVKKNSVVCAGTWGKTSTSALLAFILKNAGFKPAYMFGGLSLSLPYAADDEGGDWSVLEGDEYKTGKDNNRAKFFSYKPTHLLLTGLAWDHFDIYPTERSYYEAFEKLLTIVPDDGTVVACADNANLMNLLKKSGRKKFITYGSTKDCDYYFHDVSMDTNGIQIIISCNGKKSSVHSPMLGLYMAENICAAFAMAAEIGVSAAQSISAIGAFRGIKRRLEKRGETQNGAAVFDDIAHSPVKSLSVLATLRKIFPKKIVAVFEPNTGNRQISSAESYAGCFAGADEVIIPRLTKIKINESARDEVMDAAQLSQVISRTHNNVKMIDDDEEMVAYLKKQTGPGDAIVFLGSHGFRGMIDKLSENK